MNASPTQTVNKSCFQNNSSPSSAALWCLTTTWCRFNFHNWTASFSPKVCLNLSHPLIPDTRVDGRILNTFLHHLRHTCWPLHEDRSLRLSLSQPSPASEYTINAALHPAWLCLRCMPAWVAQREYSDQAMSHFCSWCGMRYVYRPQGGVLLGIKGMSDTGPIPKQEKNVRVRKLSLICMKEIQWTLEVKVDHLNEKPKPLSASSPTQNIQNLQYLLHWSL